MSGCPKISIITPTLNAEAYLRQAIDAVLVQGYDSIEHILVDGDSSDGTLEIVKSFPHLIWISEKDEGAADATRKGLAMASGDIVCLLPADDYYEPGAFEHVVELFNANPECQWVAGRCHIVDRDGKEIRKYVTWYKNALLRRHSFKRLLTECYISGQAVFFKRELLVGCGDLLRDWSEYELWLRFAKKHLLTVTDRYLVNFRMHEGAVTSTNFMFGERIAFEASRKHGKQYPFAMFLRHLNHYKILVFYSCFNRFLKG